MTSACNKCSKRFKNKKGLTMHKRIAHPVEIDLPPPTVQSITPEQLEDLRNFVASLVNSLASHAGTLFNKMNSDVNDLKEKVDLISKNYGNQTPPSISQLPPLNSQPPFLDQHQPTSPSLSEILERCSLEFEKSIEQMLEEFPASKETSPNEKGHQTFETRSPVVSKGEPTKRVEEEPSPQCQEAETPFLYPKKYARHADLSCQRDVIAISNSYSPLSSEPSETSESYQNNNGTTDKTLSASMPAIKENLPKGLFHG